MTYGIESTESGAQPQRKVADVGEDQVGGIEEGSALGDYH